MKTSVWIAPPQSIDNRTTQYSIQNVQGNTRLSYADVFSLLATDESFRSFWSKTLAESPWESFFFEVPSIMSRTLNRSFEFVLVESSALGVITADAQPFASHFAAHPGEFVIAFPNLGGDALLLVPTPQSHPACYAHMARFVRDAPVAQIHAFWQRLGKIMLEQVSNDPLWLSTAGLGVSWLHLRLDSRPKYYRYEPYKMAPSTP